VALEFRILWAGRKQPPEWERLCAGYRQRIAAFHPVEERAIRVPSASGDPGRLRAEGEALAAAAPADGYWIALDRAGRALDSEQLAARVAEWRRSWSRPVVCFVGSDLGLDPALVDRCRERWSLGPLTLPHALARLVLLEQLFRALAIGAGWPYHRA
jgi:23S rRNA (pseudouridine1915-N3)-methyltransferase